jgi:squalene-associated FAD-dependent desaturase
MHVAVVGAGWAGLAAAVQATALGHRVTVLEASRTLGGRARALPATLADGSETLLDNGQHILIGAYRDTLVLMRTVGVNPDTAFLRLPLQLQQTDGSGLRLPDWPPPWNLLAGILSARGWTLRDKLSLLATAARWQRQKFKCDEHLTVAALCQDLSSRLRQTLIDPLCVSALNTPAHQASARVFLRVMHDALIGARGSSDLLLPRTDLSALMPQAAAQWLKANGSTVLAGQRVEALQAHGDQWTVRTSGQTEGRVFDAVVLATPSSVAAQLARDVAASAPAAWQATLHDWTHTTEALRFEAITTVYTHHPQARLTQAMLALHSNAQSPAQFVFDRGQLGGPHGLLAWVVSASQGDRDRLQDQVLQQAQALLGLNMQAVQTVVEKRATFACTPGLRRPGMALAPGLWVCGDYIDGPYPATLEGAVRSGLAAAQATHTHGQRLERPSTSFPLSALGDTP